jgi:kynureninase
VIRVCPAPLYFSFEDVYRVVETVREVIESGAYEEDEPTSSGVT